MSLFATITAADNGETISNDEPSFKIPDISDQTSENDATKHVFIGFRSKPGQKEKSLVLEHKGKIRSEFIDLNAFAADIPQDKIDTLSRDPKVLYIEEDPMRYVLGLSDFELEPSLSNGLYGLITSGSTSVHARGITGEGAVACIADTAIDTDHPDIFPNLIETANFNSQSIDIFNETHATHVAGTVIAALNNKGIRGVAYNASLYHARVLGPEGGLASEVMDGVRWLVEDEKCKIVGLSLGDSRRSRTEEIFYRAMYDEGALIVAAAGNENSKRLSFPAGYKEVLAVGAVDRNNVHASFSNTGKNLDLSAPGVDVLSSVPRGMGSESFVIANNIYHNAYGLELAGKTTGVSGTIVNCSLGNSASDFPSTVAGNIALIMRGSATFESKVDNAMKAGASAVIIYNNVAGDFIGSLVNTTNYTGSAWIPAVSVSDTTGAILVEQAGQTAIVGNQISDWDYYSGTSMATPHVVGVAALVSSANHSLTNIQIETILKSTATDLGKQGHDTTYGFGIVNASAAVDAASSP
jgi:subtilisin family serine protease